MDYFTFLHRSLTPGYEVREHTTPAEQEEFWREWNRAQQPQDLASYIRNHLPKR